MKLKLIPLCLLALACATLSCSRSMNLDSSELAKCMTENDVKLYSLDNCSACERQKAIFGTGAAYLNVIECSSDENADECHRAEIRTVPTWRRGDGSKLVGVHSLASLADWSGCR